MITLEDVAGCAYVRIPSHAGSTMVPLEALRRAVLCDRGPVGGPSPWPQTCQILLWPDAKGGRSSVFAPNCTVEDVLSFLREVLPPAEMPKDGTVTLVRAAHVQVQAAPPPPPPQPPPTTSPTARTTREPRGKKR